MGSQTQITVFTNPTLRLGHLGLYFGLGSMFVWAGCHKLVSPEESSRLIDYFVAPISTSSQILARVLGGGCLLGLWLCSGKWPRASLAAALIALAVFSLVLARAKLKGYAGACGCLGLKESVPRALARNALLFIAVSIAIAFRVDSIGKLENKELESAS